MYTANVITNGIVTGSVMVEVEDSYSAIGIFNALLNTARHTEGSDVHRSFIVDIRKVS